ncbi:MAG: XisI protein [Anaerolineae bacterium]|nr:XisI protein [Anaerolineae bacterium]
MMSTLSEITRREVALYIAHSDTSKFYSLMDEAQKLYAVVSVPHLPRPWPSRVVVMAQVVGDKVIVIEDNTDKPLVDALMVNGGVPREQIILAYAGEPVPTI